LALASGAEDYFPTSDKGLKSAVEQIARDLAQQYTLSYYPSDSSPSDRYRRITVKVNLSGVNVRARQGYILPKVTASIPWVSRLRFLVALEVVSTTGKK